jgi:hypothetical protein
MSFPHAGRIRRDGPIRRAGPIPRVRRIRS